MDNGRDLGTFITQACTSEPPPSWCNKETVNTPSTGRAPCLALSLSRRLSPWSRRTDPDTVSREMISRHGGMKSSQKTINACFVVDIDNVPDNMSLVVP